MKTQEFTDAVRGIQPDPALKEKVLAPQGAVHKKTPRRVLWPAAAALIALALVAGFLLLPAAPDAGQDLVITAYAASGQSVGLAPNVETPLGRYSPAMSSVPGLPFDISFVQGSGEPSRFTAEVRVDAGSLLTWEAQNGRVTHHGQALTLRGGSTVYWSPAENGKAAEGCRMTVVAQRSSGASAEAVIGIRQTPDNGYAAEITYMASYPVSGTIEDQRAASACPAPLLSRVGICF